LPGLLPVAERVHGPLRERGRDPGPPARLRPVRAGRAVRPGPRAVLRQHDGHHHVPRALRRPEGSRLTRGTSTTAGPAGPALVVPFPAAPAGRRPTLAAVQICPSCGEENPDRFRLCGFCGTQLAQETPAEEVRRTVSVVFSDLKGSTTLGEQLDS